MLSAAQREMLFARSTTIATSANTGLVHDQTREIIATVRASGDNALRELGRRFDGVDLGQLEVPAKECVDALDSLDPTLRRALERAATNIETVHRAMRPVATRVSPEAGVVIVRRPDPLSRVGVYAPGGRAAYPSSLLMGAVPARTAGVDEVIVCSPPSSSGYPLPVVLAAARIARVDRVFAVGGAGAIAAMAFGTETVPRVDRIVGPGNAYVAEAKLQVVSQVAIDSPAGPSELLVLGDQGADALRIAHEVLAQAEHDPDAAVSVVLVGDDAASALTRVTEAITELLARAPRGDIAGEAISRRSAFLTAESFETAITFANAFAAEHLLLCVSDSIREEAIVAALRNTGTVFTGSHGSVVFGDYITGANHVLPTAGLARAYSGLSALDFFRWTTFQEVGPEAAKRFADDTGLLANSEGLPAHAAAARFASGLAS
jgi:histidinol dehydrogenase